DAERGAPVATPIHSASRVGDHQDLQVVLQRRAGRGTAERHLIARQVGMHRVAQLRPPRRADVRVIAQVLANAGQFVDEGNARGAQLIRRPNARQHQKVWRADRTGREDDLVPVHGLKLAPARDLHADGPPTLEEDPLNDAARSDGQIQTVTRWIDVAEVRPPANALVGVERDRSDPLRVWRVEVGTLGEAQVAARLHERDLRWEPFVLSEASNWNRAVVPVVGTIAEVEVALE